MGCLLCCWVLCLSWWSRSWGIGLACWRRSESKEITPGSAAPVRTIYVSCLESRDVPHMTAPRRILIEGWRFLPHSYAVVNAFQILELLRRPGIELYHHDQPYYNAMWRKTVGLFSPAAEA